MIELLHIDCMKFMAGKPDNYYDLAIVDPPFGIGRTWDKSKRQQFYGHKNNFNDIAPGEHYFKQLFRISKNQIIFGGNYYVKFLSVNNSWIFWDKGRDLEKTFMSEGELMWTSFKLPMRKIKIKWDGFKKGSETHKKMIHPHQKPIELYRWILKKYAKEKDRIIDTHGGSMSIAIACHDMGYNIDICELDKNYFTAGKKRVKIYTAQSNFMTLTKV